MRRAAAMLLALCLLPAVSGVAGQKRDLKEENKRREQRLNDPAHYEAMIDAYRAGETARSVDLLADPEWDATRLTMLLHHLDTVPMQSAVADTLWRVAPMLHIDVALQLSPTLEADAEQAGLHLEFAGSMLRLGIRERGAPIQVLAERLYVALARLLQDRSAPYSAERILRIARDRIPNRASILYASGILAETFATDYALIGRTTLHTTDKWSNINLRQIQERRTAHLNDAAEWLGQAARLDPEDDLLRVHLGRVMALRTRDDEALAILDRTLTTTTDDATAYLAAMFIGGLRERQGRLDDAITAYRSAAARFPLGHAAAVGLSEVLQRMGRGDEARDVLQTLLTEKSGPVREPLWWYPVDPPGVAEARLDAIRREVRQ